MKDLMKLTYSWSQDTCTIYDGMSNKSLQIDLDTCSCLGTLDTEAIIPEIMALIESLNTYTMQRKMFLKNPTDYKQGIVIRDLGHFHWDCSEEGNYAMIEANKITASSSFNKGDVLRKLYSTVTLIQSLKPRLDPRVDIVRRIPDCRLLVWVYKNTCIAVAERNIEGMAMSNALINGEYYQALLVDVSRENNTCNVFDFSTGDAVFSCPVDNSILTYFVSSEDAL